MAFKGKGRAVNRDELAEVFGVSLNTVTSWIRSGCPFEQQGRQGKPWRFNTRDVSEWLREQARADAASADTLDENLLKLRKLAAEAEQAEFDLAVARGKVAPIEEFERARALENATVRANVMNVSDRVVTQLLGETDEGRFKEILRAELIAALETSADAEIDLEEEADDDDADG
ncbi:phage terminase Nu1 subunit (DNA packaging protein) [Kushneria sinocarnis]|uniref:Phage terminase Nu1 subunit (DNA packaging protein) n=1 Tax=Kushneria sinocarnis TaxID=595502 RepID=A0A420WVL8_9GAMM|nr:terminase small subunit [Kushneria sinocarnis]RKR02603.1 phage terminase Nu1 subunit (DNA packaging protein) [Kushneria sinocarnis]